MICVNHQQEQISFLCVNPQCQIRNVGCEQCQTTLHESHQEDCIRLNQLILYIESTPTIQIFNQVIEEMINNSQSLLESLKEFKKYILSLLVINEEQQLINLGLKLKLLCNQQGHQFNEQITNYVIEINKLSSKCQQDTKLFQKLLESQKQELIIESDVKEYNQVQISQDQQIVCEKCRKSINEKIYSFQVPKCNHLLCQECMFLNFRKQLQKQCLVCHELIENDALVNYFLLFKQEQIYESNIYERCSFLNSDIDLELIAQKYINNQQVSDFVSIFDHLLSLEEEFVDPDFPPTQKSIGKPGYQWARAESIYKYQSAVFIKDEQNGRHGMGKWISSADIIQGGLGNCYFLASISALGYWRPDLIMDLFITRKVNPIGIYAVQLCISGIWRVVYVDDFFPIIQKENKIKVAFTKSRNNAIWVQILEKALAKLYGSYFSCQSGQISQALRMLTGAPTSNLFSHQSDFLQQLQCYIDEKAIMTASSDSNSEEQGLVKQHAYTILKIVVIEHQQRGIVQLLKLRNPWGHQEWKGDWSYSSELWTPELRNSLKVEKGNGIFYMDMGSFMQNFSYISVCHLNEKNYYNSIQLDVKKAGYVMFNIEKEGQYYISVIQEDSRIPGNQPYCLTKLLIVELKQDSYTLLNAKREKTQSLTIRHQFKPGQYIIYAKVIWDHAVYHKFVCSIYGPNQVQLTSSEKHKDLLRSAFLKQAMQFPQQRTKLSKRHFYQSLSLSGTTGWGYYLIENNSGKDANVNIQFIELNNVELCDPYSGDNVIAQILAGNQLICVVKCGESQSSFKAASQIEYIVH